MKTHKTKNTLETITAVDELLSGSIHDWPSILYFSGNQSDLQYFITKLLAEKFKAETECTPVHLTASTINKQDLELALQQGDIFSSSQAVFVCACEKNKKILEAVSNPNLDLSSTKVILTYTGKANKLLKKNSKSTASLSEFLCTETDYRSTAPLISWFAEKIDLKLDKKVVSFLSGAFEGNLQGCLQQLKLLKFILSDSSKTLTTKDIQPYLQTLSLENNFSITNALLAKDFAKANFYIEKFILSGENAIALTGLLAFFMRQVIVFDLQNRNQSSPALKAKVPPFLYDKYRSFAKAYGKNAVMALKECQHADQKLKSSRLNPALLLNNALHTLQQGNSQ